MPEEIEIRSLRTEDTRGFWECVGAVARERAYLVFLDAPPYESSQRWVQKLIDSGYPAVVALDEDRIVGWCDIGPNEREPFRHRGTLGVGMLPPYRGRGLGRRLILAALDRAREVPGLERVELTVFAANENARRLYEKLGFAHEGRLRKAKKLDGSYDDLLWMGLLLD